jgi:hypothetical protein
MNIVLDTPVVRIWADSDAPYAFSVFFSWPSSEHDFVKLAETYTDLLKKVKHVSGEVYSICDISQPKGAPGNSIKSLFETCVEKHLKLGVKRKAFVLPSDFPKGLFSQAEIVQSDRISFHQTFQQALTEINNTRMNAINRSMSIL